MHAFRAADHADLPRAAALSARIGWNQNARDWRVFLDQGAVRALDDGDAGCLAATAAVLPFGPRLAWISMVLVRPDRRREGLATALMQWASGTLAATPCIALDATPAGREVYRRLGFADCFGFARWSLPAALPGEAGLALRPLRPADWPTVLALDEAAFGASRAALLRDLAARMPEAAFVTADGRGFVLAREGLRAPQIGPVVAPDAGSAIALITAARAALAAPAVLDLADAASEVAAFLARHGGVMLRPFTRMARGHPPIAKAQQNFVFAGPEFG
jgi:GNAT superfamily N-acetyltransferase